ncbi:MAG: hypothetical protein ACE5G2_02360 [Candidatus Krumholzibacteriia bacterium]
MTKYLVHALAIVFGCTGVARAEPAPLSITVSPLGDCTCQPYVFGVWHPAWSPDGAYLAMAGGNAYPPSYLYWGYVFVVPVGGGPDECAYGDHVFVEYPAWAPDSRRVVFADGLGLRILDCDGNDPPAQLLEGWARHPAWSPDGSTIAFESSGNVWLVSASGGVPAQLTTQGGYSPKWSPDGTRIAYQAGGSIWIIPVAGGGPRRLTEGTDPAWSPDGIWIAFASDRGGNSDIWVIATTGGTAVRVTSAPEAESDPTWAPDQRRLAYTAVQGECSCVYIASDLPPDWTVPVSSTSWGHVKTLYK